MRTKLPGRLGRVAMVLSAFVSLAAAEGEWPTFRGANHDGKSPDTGLLKEWPAGGPKLLWKTSGIGQGFSGAAVSGGMIYTTGNVNNRLVIFALDGEGQVKWKVDHGPAWTKNKPGARGTPTIDEGSLYLLGDTGILGCYDAGTGKRKWFKEASALGGKPGTWGYAESPLILDNLVIFKPGGKNCIVALDKKTGKGAWASSGFSADPQYSCCLPFTFEDKPMLVTGTSGGLVCVSAKDGSLLWSNGFCAGNTANCPTPAYADGYVFWANGYNKGGICMKLGPGGKASEAWKTDDMVCHHGGYVIHERYVYGNNGNGWACLELATGRKAWDEKAVGKGSLCWADGMLYLFSETKGQAALATCSPKGLEIKGRVQVDGEGPSWAHPVVIGGRLYLRYDTTLYCFDVKAK